MTRELMEDANLAMRQGSKLELVSYTGHNWSFFSLCEDVGVAIEGLKTRHLIFVVEARHYDVVLGQPFLNSVKFSKEYKPDKIFGTIIYPHTYQTAIFRTLAHQDSTNQRENQIFLQSFH